MNTQPTEVTYLSAEKDPQAVSAKRGEGRVPKILVVEDEFMVAFNIKEDLVRSGYQVPAIAASGEEAIRRAIEVQPDLILMDITLDGPMDGIEAAAEIMKIRPVPVVYLTAHFDAETVTQAKKIGAFGFLPKPCGRVAMMSAIEMALCKHSIDTEKQQRERGSFKDSLLAKSAKLEEANIALKVLMEQRELERRELEQNIQTNISKLILPSLSALENSKLAESQKILVESIKLNLQLLTDAHLSRFGGSVAHLSSTEMQVANFVKAGKSTKEIAQFLNIAPSTINTHRDSIREKMGIKNTKTNLKKTLQQML